MNEPRLNILSLLDTRAMSGPSRGLIHLARTLPSNAWLHLGVLCFDAARDIPAIAETAGHARLTVHPLHEGGSFNPAVVARARDLARDVRADIIQSHSYKPHIIAWGLRQLYGAPWIAFHHNWSRENFKMKLYHSWDRLTLRGADRVVAVSHRAEQVVLSIGCRRDRTVMITNAVDPIDFACNEPIPVVRDHFGLPRDVRVALAVGRLSYEKGHDVLLRAFAAVAADMPDWVVAIAGEGINRRALVALASELGLRDRVFFLGFQNAIDRLYAASDLLVMPSRDEGMPNAMLEAMASGLPVVATSVGGIPEAARDGENAWIVPCDDVPAFAAAFLDAAQHPEKRDARAREARAHVLAHMAPAARTQKLCLLYSTLLGGRWHPAYRPAIAETLPVAAP